MKTKTETIENFEIKYKKHPFSNSIKISIKEKNCVLVTLPYFCAFKTAREFLLKNFEKIKNVKIERKLYDINFKTKFDTLKIIESDTLKTQTKKGVVYFYYPKSFNFESETIQDELKKAHNLALKIEAKNFLPQRLAFLAQKYGFKYNKVALKNQKTRFGSCSFTNNINLNINLMNYDFDIIDYVLIHELVHTKIKNHSETFWKAVEEFCPNYRELRKRLKNR